MSAAGYRFSLMLCCLLLMGFCARSVLADDIDVIKARLQKDDVGADIILL